MTCPQCGLQILPDQKFCRSCGARLQLTTQPLAESVQLADLEVTTSTRHESPQASPLLFWGFIIMFVGVAIGVVGKKLLHEDIVTVIGILVSLAGMFLSVYPYLSPSRRQKNDSIPSSQPEALTDSPPP